jgi:thioester reductase-like protein
MEDLVARAFCETLQLPAVGTRDPFFSVGGSSLAAVQIAATLSERLSLAIDAQDVLETSTVEALAERISARLTGNARRPASREDLLADVLLDPEIRAPAPTAYPAPLDAAGIFLTGATGFFGAFLLRALLERTSGPVRCLVRASDEREARGRLSAAWQRVAGAASSLPERALAVPGDLARPRLGMSAADWDAAAVESDFIFHGGASVSYLLPYRALRGANVLGTEEVLRLAAQKKLKRVHHVSTIDVAAAHGPGAPERDDVAEPESLGNGYAQTKWVAERLAGIAQERGIPVAIYRPGRLVADSRNGVANGNDFLLRLVQACVAAGVLPDFDLQLDMTPVDYASAAMAALAFGGGAGAVFHLVHPHPVPWSLLSRALHDFGYHLRVLPFETWRAALRRSGRRADGDAFALYLAGMEEPRLRAALEALHGCERTVAALAAHGLRCPTIDAALLRVHLAHLVRSGMLPAPG